MAISTHPGMGAVPADGFTTFRVWAPHALGVSVVGTFNGWDKTSNPLTSENNEYWSTDVPGVGIGAQYKFVIVNPAVGGNGELWKNDPYVRELTTDANHNINGVIADPNFNWDPVPFQIPDSKELVIYELHVSSFLFDPTSRWGRGTFRSLISKLDYLNDLGINAIEIMAASEFETDTSWGYNPAYMFAIESDYGGPNGFRELVNEAHRRGIAVIFDVVYNHFGNEGLDIWQFDGWKPGSDNTGGIYFYNDDLRRGTPWGGRPDYGRQAVQDYFRDNALRWLTTRGVDGLRWDATGYIRNTGGDNNSQYDIPDGWRLMQRINGEIQQQPSRKISIAEDMQNNKWLTKDTGANGAGFSAQWDAVYLHTMRDTLTATSDDNRDVNAVRNVLTVAFNGSAFQRVIYTESHDEDHTQGRVPQVIDGNDPTSYFAKKRSTLGAALTLTAPGIPMLFQGQEFLEVGWFEDNPRELDWSKFDTFNGIFRLYRDLIHLRRNWFDNTAGLRGENINVFHARPDDKVVAFHRWENGGAGDDVVVVANFTEHAYDSFSLGFPRGGLWKVRFNSDWNGYDANFGNQLSYDTAADPDPLDDLPYSGNVGIGAYSVIILSQDQ